MAEKKWIFLIAIILRLWVFQEDPEDVRKRSERREDFLAKRRSGSYDSVGQLRRENSGITELCDSQHSTTKSAPPRLEHELQSLRTRISSAEADEIFQAVQEVR